MYISLYNDYLAEFLRIFTLYSIKWLKNKIKVRLY